MMEAATMPTNVGSEIARLRNSLGATQSQVASRANLDQSRVSRIEKGETSNQQ